MVKHGGYNIFIIAASFRSTSRRLAGCRVIGRCDNLGHGLGENHNKGPRLALMPPFAFRAFRTFRALRDLLSHSILYRTKIWIANFAKGRENREKEPRVRARAPLSRFRAFRTFRGIRDPTSFAIQPPTAYCIAQKFGSRTSRKDAKIAKKNPAPAPMPPFRPFAFRAFRTFRGIRDPAPFAIQAFRAPHSSPPSSSCPMRYLMS